MRDDQKELKETMHKILKLLEKIWNLHIFISLEFMCFKLNIYLKIQIYINLL
jgi:hypothetical protein